MMPSDVRAAQELAPGDGTTTQGGGEAKDLEKGPEKAAALDIEHLKVDDDPRLWSDKKKNSVLAIIAFTAMGGTITASVFFPALDSLQASLHTTDSLLALTVSLFILGQGGFPQCWTAISEVSGRKRCYLAALAIYVTATAVASRATSIGVFIAMRILQALGSSAVLALGAGSLADIYDTHERGTKLGVFYAVPLVGPALGPIIGGAVTSASDWRATFYFLLAYGALCFVLMMWMPNTFRKERSLAWRKAMERSRQHAREELAKARAALPRDDKAEKQLVVAEKATTFAQPQPEEGAAQGGGGFSPLNKVRTALSAKSGEVKVKIHFRDVNPLAATGDVLRSPSNALVLTYSGFLFASQYCITYTASRTFAAAPYNFTAIEVGLVLLSFGLGNVLGSVGGGRYSDYILRQYKKKNGGVGEPEMRIKSTYAAMVFLPPLFVAYAWLVRYEVIVAGPVVILFFLGASIMVIYASTLAYVVDANPGRSTSAVAVNSLFRGVLACIASQVAEPILDKVHDGAFYTGWAVILALGELALVLVSVRGKVWRERAREKEERRADKQKKRREERLRLARERVVD
ncbi:hypothetical protein JCM5296_003479 [Sporobolomyces johnsonii]